MKLNNFPEKFNVKLNPAVSIPVSRYDLEFHGNYVVIPDNVTGTWTGNQPIYIKTSFGTLHFTAKQIVRLLEGKALTYYTRDKKKYNLYFDALGQYDNHRFASRGKLFLDFNDNWKDRQQLDFAKVFGKPEEIQDDIVTLEDADLPF